MGDYDHNFSDRGEHNQAPAPLTAQGRLERALRETSDKLRDAERRLARIHEKAEALSGYLLGSEMFHVVAEISELSKGETK